MWESILGRLGAPPAPCGHLRPGNRINTLQAKLKVLNFGLSEGGGVF